MRSQTQQAIDAIIEVTGHTEGQLFLSLEERRMVVDRLYSSYKEGSYKIKSAKATQSEKSIIKYIGAQVSDVVKKKSMFNNNFKKVKHTKVRQFPKELQPYLEGLI